MACQHGQLERSCDICDLQCQLAALTKEREGFSGQIAALLDERTVLRSELDKRTLQRDERNRKVNELLGDISELQAENQRLADMYARESDETRKLQAELAEVRERNHKRNNDIQKEWGRLQDENAELVAALELCDANTTEAFRAKTAALAKVKP